MKSYLILSYYVHDYGVLTGLLTSGSCTFMTDPYKAILTIPC